MIHNSGQRANNQKAGSLAISVLSFSFNQGLREKVLTKDQAKNQFRLRTKEEELLTIWFGGIIDMYFCLSPYFKFPINSSLFRTWCKMWKIIVQDSFWSNLIIVDALSETEMRWIWTRVGHAYVAHQILGSFEAKNITCVFLHENSNLAIEITKDVFPDVKKCKKVRKSGLKRLFCIF